MVRVVCFDVGGVLIDITHFWHEAATHAGIKLPDRVAAEARLLDAPPFDPYQGGNLAKEIYAQQLAEFLGVTPEQALLVHSHIMMEPHEGVEGIIAELNDLGLVTACLSNTNELHWLDMNESGRFPGNQLLQLRVASHDLNMQKPDVRIFRKFEEISGHAGEEILFFEDTHVNFEPAKSLGWQVFPIDPDRPTAPQICMGLRQSGIDLACCNKTQP